MKNNKLYIDSTKPPKVLLLGNGILQLNKGLRWSELIEAISPDTSGARSLKGIPYAMQPEAVCGTNVEEVQRKTAKAINNSDSHTLLEQLVDLEFDAILTTNYTYEIEVALSGGKWTENKRKSSHTTLKGSPHVRHNTHKCNLVKCRNGRTVPVFHVHGEKDRKHSLVLSYYSYANAVYQLIDMNKERSNIYAEKQADGSPIECYGWLDYFLLGEVYAIGFGFDLSEFDIWWAMERKSREKAFHGQLHAYMIEKQQDFAKSTMFETMNVDERFIEVQGEDFPKAYEKVLAELRSNLGIDQ